MINLQDPYHFNANSSRIPAGSDVSFDWTLHRLTQQGTEFVIRHSTDNAVLSLMISNEGKYSMRLIVQVGLSRSTATKRFTATYH